MQPPGPAVPVICDGTAQNTPSLTSQPYPSTEYLEDWLARTVELVDYAGDRVVFGFRGLIQGPL